MPSPQLHDSEFPNDLSPSPNRLIRHSGFPYAALPLVLSTLLDSPPRGASDKSHWHWAVPQRAPHREAIPLLPPALWALRIAASFSSRAFKV